MLVLEILAAWVGVSVIVSPVIGRFLSISTRQQAVSPPRTAVIEFRPSRSRVYSGGTNHAAV